ncbi:MAG: type I polyketide synthase [Halioglobus sp.]|nr:type I polyketide synthase [Halioglobus sp.]
MKEARMEQDVELQIESTQQGAEGNREDTLRKALVAISSLKQKLSQDRQRATEDVAIVGMACRFPGGCDTPEAFWDLLSGGRRTVAPVPDSRWDIEQYYNPVPGTPGKMYVRELNFVDDVEYFDCQFFGVTPKEARSLDPHQRLLLQIMWHAMEDSGITAASIRGTDASVFMGQSSSDYALRLNRYSDIEEMDGFVATGNNYSVTSGRMSYLLGINGPCMTIDTACSSSLVCLNQAVEALRAGRTGLAFVGASHVMSTPESCLALSHAQALAPDGMSKPFDNSADGYGRGEGGAVLILKRLSNAERDGDRILALIEESVINQDGASGGLMVPNGNAQTALIEAALQRSGLAPEDIQYIEAHGTGTPIGDPIEAAAIAAALGQRDREVPLLMGSSKANIGHLEAASGMAALLKVVMMLQREQIVAQPGPFEPSRQIDWASMSVEVPTETRAWQVPEGVTRRAGINGFGFSGMNGHVILKQYEMQQGAQTQQQKPALMPPLLVYSAKHPDVLSRLSEQYADLIDSDNAEAICRAAAQRRDHWPHRVAVAAETVEDMRFALRAHADGMEGVNLHTGSSGRAPKTVFMFTGQGSQYVGMGKYLYDHEPVFRDVMDRCNQAVSPTLECDLLELVFRGDEVTLADTAYTQPALFALEVALAALWRHWGIEPQALVGHSVGQYSAACVAGVFSVEDGARLIAQRGQLMAQLPALGGMLAISADRATVSALVDGLSLLDIAAINGPEQTVVSGHHDAIAGIADVCSLRGLATKPLNVSHAFHSALMDPILAPFFEVAGQIAFQAPDIDVLCNVSGRFADPDDMLTPDYWVRHLRQPVNFNDCMKHLVAQGYDCFVEIGPAPVLCAMGEIVARHQDRDVRWIPTLRRPRAEGEVELRRQLQHSLAAVYCAGVDIDWARIQGVETDQQLSLPAYPFERKYFWPEGEERKGSHAFPSGSPLQLLQSMERDTNISELLGSLVQQGSVSESNRALAAELLQGLNTWHRQVCRYGDLDEWFLQLSWCATNLPDAPAAISAHWLILRKNDSCSFALSMQALLQRAGHRVSTIETDELTSSAEPSLVKRLTALPDVNHCLLLAHWQTPRDSAGVDFAAVRANSVDLLLDLVQTLESRKSAARVWIPTRQVWNVGSETPGVEHFHSPLWIMARNLYREMPHRLGAALDLAANGEAAELHEAIERLVSADVRHEYQWLLRGDSSYVPRLESVAAMPIGAHERWLLDDTSRYMITGPFGGIGLAVTQLLVDCGARHLCLVSRSGPVSEAARSAVNTWRNAGVEVSTPLVDVADPVAVATLFDSLNPAQPLKGLIHTAGVTADGMLEDLTRDDFARVMGPKVNGTWLLDKHSREHTLDFFVCFSSTSALLGAPGLANYASANFYMDALMAHRRSLGYCGLSIQWGTWAEVGMVAKLGHTHLTRQAAQGWQLIGTADGMRAFERIMIASQSSGEMPDAPIVMPVADWSRVLTVLGGRQDAQFALLSDQFGDTDDLEGGVEQAVFTLLSLHEDEQVEFLTARLKTKIAIGFGFDEADLSINESLVSLGMDSLLAVQLKMALQKMLGVDLPMEILLEGASIAELSRAVLAELVREEPSSATSSSEQVSMVL